MLQFPVQKIRAKCLANANATSALIDRPWWAIAGSAEGQSDRIQARALHRGGNCEPSTTIGDACHDERTRSRSYRVAHHKQKDRRRRYLSAREAQFGCMSRSACANFAPSVLGRWSFVTPVRHGILKR
jgi:hypothetical protein